MSHPSHVLCSAIFPSPASFLKYSGLSSIRGSDVCIVRKSVWFTNRAAHFARSIQCSSSTVMVMMSSMNPSICASVAVMSTNKGYYFVRCLVEYFLSSCGIKDVCGDFGSSMSQGSSRSRLFPRSIAASLTVVYSSGTVVVPKDNRMQRKASSYTIYMQVDMVLAFLCIRR